MIVRITVALALVVLPVAAVPGTATAKPTIEQVKRQVEALRTDAEKASEEYNATRERLRSLQVRVQAAKVRMAQQRRQVGIARRELGRLAAETYKSGELSGLSLFLGDDPDAVMAQTGLLATLGERQADVVEELRVQEARLRADTADVQRQSTALATASASLRTSSRAVRAKLDEAQAVLSRLEAGQRAELARITRAAERRALEAVGSRGPAPESCDASHLGAGSARVQKVLRYACEHLGDPYVWGASGPRGFDCSGLTQQAWARAGVSLPHNAAMQANYGRSVSASQLKPGDLVFYHRPISHTGIYIGDGLMIHAPHSGDVVRIAAVRYGSLVAAVRL